MAATQAPTKNRQHRPRIALRWWIAFLLFLSTTINYIDRQALSQSAPLISRLLHISDKQYSYVTASFMVAYTIMPMIGGWLMDQLGTKLGLTLSVLWWSVIGVLHATARGLYSLMGLRFLLGIGEGANWPGATKTVSEWFPESERSLAVGFFDSGSSIGAIIATWLMAILLARYNWRIAFLVTGALGFGWVALWQVFYYPWQEHPRLSPQERAEIEASHLRQERDASHQRVPIWSLLRLKQVWAIIVGRICSDGAWWFLAFWLPKYLDSRGFSTNMIGAFAWIPFLFADLGNFAGGGGSTWLAKHGWSLTRARRAVILATGTVMTVAAPLALLHSNVFSMVAISAYTFFYAAFSTMMLSLPSDLFEPQMVGSAAGVCQTGAGAGGVAFQLTVGALLASFSSYTPVFWMVGTLALVGTVTVLTLVPQVRILQPPLMHESGS